MSLFDTGVRPEIDKYLLAKSQEVRDYGNYWSASSAGYCMRKVIFDRLKVPKPKEDARKQRVFEAGHIFHEWVQRITKNAGLSIAQELELQDESLMVRGHIDDLVLVDGTPMLIDYKTQNSRAFSFQKDRPMSHFHRMQVGTYLLLLRTGKYDDVVGHKLESLAEARILKISKDDLRMSEQQLLWSLELESDVAKYWGVLNGHWKSKMIPRCTCADHEGGFMAKEAYNDYWYDGEPCSIKWLLACIKEKQVEAANWTAER